MRETEWAGVRRCSGPRAAACGQQEDSSPCAQHEGRLSEPQFGSALGRLQSLVIMQECLDPARETSSAQHVQSAELCLVLCLVSYRSKHPTIGYKKGVIGKFRLMILLTGAPTHS